MGWKCYVKDSVSYAAMTDETQALAYRVEWAMDHPATVEVLVNDDSGAKSQTYGTGYLGTSALLLEQPTATEIFRGRIVGVEPNPSDGVVKLFAEDWLSQLNDRLVIYDTRENLGNGYREFPAGRPHHYPYGYQTGWDHDGASHILTLDSHQELGAWVNDQWNGYRLVVPSGRHMGEQVDRAYAYDETATSDAAPFTTDTPADGEQNTWLHDATDHTLSDTVGANQGFTVEYTFRTFAATSDLVASIDAIDVTTICKAYGAGLTHFYVMLDYGHGAVYDVIYLSTSGAMTQDREITGSASFWNPANYFDANGDIHVVFWCWSTGGGVVSLDVDQLYLDVHYTVDTALTTTYNIADTLHGVDAVDRLYLTGDPITDGAVSCWPFSITQLATIYVADLVTTYDELYALSTADVTASTHYIARHYHRQTPLQILRDLATVDGTQFWLDKWDGDSLDLHWNDAFGGAAVATWTDASVLSWTPGGYRLKEVINEAFVEGYTHGDVKVMDDYIDAGGSVAAYGQRSRYVNNPDIGRQDEALAEATNIVTRLKDPRLLLSGVLNGYSTVNLGDIVTVNSAKFNINTDYVVTRKVYDSQSATSTFDLTPKTTLLTVRPPISQFVTRLDDRITQLETTTERSARYTDIWT